MSERSDELRVRPEIQCAHRQLLVFRARMAFGRVYSPAQVVKEDECNLLKTVHDLLLDTGRRYLHKIPLSRPSDQDDRGKRSSRQKNKERLAEVERIAGDALAVIGEKIRSGECYAFYQTFLNQPFHLVLIQSCEKDKLKGLPDNLRIEKADDEPDEAVGRLAEEAETSFRKLYQELRQQLAAEEPFLPMLDRYLAPGKAPWASDMAREEFKREDNQKTLEYLIGRYQRLRRGLFQRIHDVFNEWLLMWAKDLVKLLGKQPQSREPEDTAENVKEVFRHLFPAVESEPASAEAEVAQQLSLRRSDPDQERKRWIRGRQGELMFQWALRSPDRPSLHDLLAAYADLAGMPEAEILEQVYPGIPAAEARRLWTADLDTLHHWYEEITREALQTRKAWRFYDHIPHLGPGGELTRKANNHPDFKQCFAPILERVGSVRFLDLPDELGVLLKELTDRVLKLKALAAPRKAAEEPGPSPRV